LFINIYLRENKYLVDYIAIKKVKVWNLFSRLIPNVLSKNIFI
jgi:hypothetical protein